MNSQPRILLIDKARDRKERINALKNHGYAVFPALRMEEARSRCLRGGYDLIVVHADGEEEQAAQYCDEIRRNCPNQRVLMCNGTGFGREYAVPSDVASLVQEVDTVLNGGAKPADLANAA